MEIKSRVKAQLIPFPLDAPRTGLADFVGSLDPPRFPVACEAKERKFNRLMPAFAGLIAREAPKLDPPRFRWCEPEAELCQVAGMLGQKGVRFPLVFRH